MLGKFFFLYPPCIFHPLLVFLQDTNFVTCSSTFPPSFICIAYPRVLFQMSLSVSFLCSFSAPFLCYFRLLYLLAYLLQVHFCIRFQIYIVCELKTAQCHSINHHSYIFSSSLSKSQAGSIDVIN